MSKIGKEKARVVLFCGLSNAGKTTILNIFTKGDVFKTAPTLGVSLSTMAVNKDMNFRIFDLGGQEKFREEITPLLPFADIIIFVIDASNFERLPDVSQEFKRILDNSDKKLTPICVLRHKSDIKKTIKTTTLINSLGLKKVLNRNWNVISTSAVTLEGLTELYGWILRETIGREPDFKIEQKKEEEYTFHYPCPMMKEMDDGSTFCLNRDEFIETELTSFGFEDEVSKMVLTALPDLRKESLKSTGKDICPDFCILKNGEKILRCPVTNRKIETRGIKVSKKRYEYALSLSQIYGQKIGSDFCRECIYKILISPDTILSEEDIKNLRKSFF
ncbi:MAG TPA: ADP-ribosylation factor-like protein [Candidatus Bathyarchaeia archaeon]|nr:ADP-ribosylation factor-like protein [Candidatus Bathyarchaeia archaeon]